MLLLEIPRTCVRNLSIRCGLSVLLWCLAVCLWLLPSMATAAKPVLLNQPVQKVLEGQVYYAILRIGHEASEDDPLQLLALQLPKGMLLSSLGKDGCCVTRALLLWKPGASDVRTHVVSVQATTRAGTALKIQYNLEVLSTNHPPQWNSTPVLQARQGQKYTYALQASDPDKHTKPLQFRLMEAPEGMTLNSKGELSWTPSARQEGSYGVVVEVSDPKGARAFQKFVIKVDPLLSVASIVSSPARTARVGQLYKYFVQVQGVTPGKKGTFRVRSTSAKDVQLDDRWGWLRWIPSTKGTFSIEIEVNTGGSTPLRQQWQVTVFDGKNQSPRLLVFPSAAATQGVLWKTTLKAGDPDGDKLSFSLVRAPAGLSLKAQVANEATLEWTPTQQQVGEHRIEVRVEDARGGILRESWVLRVVDRNDPPRIVSQPRVQIPQGREYRYVLRTRDPDPGDTQQFLLYQGPAAMKLDTVRGILYWTPKATDAGKTHKVVVVVRDRGGLEDQQSFSVEVLDLNDPPSFVSTVPTTVSEGVEWVYKPVVSDPDSKASLVSYHLLRGPAGMTFDSNKGEFRWKTKAGDRGTYSVVVKAVDSEGGIGVQRFSLQVLARNHAPRFVSPALTGAVAGRLYRYHARVSDPDANELLTFQLLEGPQAMKMDPGTGTLTWLPTKADFEQQKSYNIRIRVTDQAGTEANQAFTLTLLEKNSFPVLVSPLPSKAVEGTLLKAVLKLTDADGDKVTCLLEKAPDGMSLKADTAELLWTPRQKDVGRQSVELRCDDGRGGVLYLRWNIEVSNTNNVPSIITIPRWLAQAGRDYVYNARATDPDHAASTLVWSLDKGPQGMSVDSQSGRILWSPGNNQAGAHEVQIKVSDGDGARAIQRFWVWVEAAIAPIQFTTQVPRSASLGQRLEYLAGTKGGDNRESLPLFSLLTAPEGMTIGPFSGVLRWKPTSLLRRSEDVILSVVAGGGKQAQQSFILPVQLSLAAPSIVSTPSLVVVAGKSWEYQLLFSNQSSDVSQYKYQLLDAASSGMQVDQNGRLSWATSLTDRGKRTLVTVEVDNGQGKVAVQSFLVDVLAGLPTNKPPVWKQVPKGTLNLSSTPWSTRLVATDPDGDPVRYRLLKAPVGMRLRTSEGTLLWQPETTQSVATLLDVEVEVLDGRGGATKAAFQIKLAGRNTPPQILSNPVTLVQGGQEFRYQVRAVDREHKPSSLVWRLVQSPASMTLSSAGEVRWQTTEKDEGLHRVTLRVSDPDKAATEHSFWVKVWKQNSAPVITSKPVLVLLEGQSWLYQLTVTDSDLPNDGLRYELLDGPASMKLYSLSGLLQWTPTNADVLKKQHSVQIQVRDQSGNTTRQSFTLTVINQNNPPVFTSLPCQKAQVGLAYNCVVFVEDVDPGTTSLSLALLHGPDALVLKPPQLTRVNGRLQAIAILEWRPRLQDVGVHQVELKASDGLHASSFAFSVTVGLEKNVPIASAGEEQTVNPGFVQLDGSQSLNSLKTPLRYEWSLLRGPVNKVTFQDSTIAKPAVVLKKAGVYTFQLIVKNESQTSAPSFVTITVKNIAPRSEILAPMGGNTGQTLRLDGSASSDSNGDPLLYQWRLVSGPEVSLKDDKAVVTEFVPQKAGVYTFELVVREQVTSTSTNGLRSEEARVSVVIHDTTKGLFVPEAVLLLPTTIVAGTPVVLDGSRSRKLGGGALRYSWSVVSGPGTAEELGRTLSTPTSETTTWSPQKAGYYQLGLVVENENLRSLQKVVGVVVQGRKNESQVPLARARSGYGFLEQWVVLDASQSIDPNKGQLLFTWTQLGGPPVVLRDAKTAKPSFFALYKASYRFRVEVRSGDIRGTPAEVVIHINQTGNQPPIAEPGSSLYGDKAPNAGVQISLDGSRSSDPEEKKLQFRWRQVSGIPVALLGDRDAKASFVPFAFGVWGFVLEVFDGITWSQSKRVEVVVNDKDNHIPVANAGPDQIKRLDEGVTLNGSASKDVDGDSLTYHWRLVSPVDAPISLNVADPQFPTFSTKGLDSGEYVFGLRVDDGKSRSLEDFVTVRVAGNNRPPKAFVKPVGNVVVDDLVVLDGTQSSDPDGDKLEYLWTQISGPPVRLNQNKSGEASFVPKSAEVYKFQLQVSDGKARSSPFEVTIQVKGKEDSNGCSCSSVHPKTPTGWWWLLVFLTGLCWNTTRRRRSL